KFLRDADKVKKLWNCSANWTVSDRISVKDNITLGSAVALLIRAIVAAALVLSAGAGAGASAEIA
ncbi:MAG: hypothetical protein AAFR82_11625, partial [Pseudomonadota bacterium]